MGSSKAASAPARKPPAQPAVAAGPSIPANPCAGAGTGDLARGSRPTEAAERPTASAASGSRRAIAADELRSLMGLASTLIAHADISAARLCLNAPPRPAIPARFSPWRKPTIPTCSRPGASTGSRATGTERTPFTQRRSRREKTKHGHEYLLCANERSLISLNVFLKVLQRHPHGCRRSSAGHLIELQQELQ